MSQHINPYIEHGFKKEHVRKVTVSMKHEVYETIQKELKRRKENNMKHATASDILCEAFVHAYTGQPLPSDKDLFRYVSKAKAERFEVLERQTRDDNINSAMAIAERYVSLRTFHGIFKNILAIEKFSDGRSVQITDRIILLYRVFNLILTFALTDTLSPYQLRKEVFDEMANVNKNQKFEAFLEFIRYCESSSNRNAHIAREIQEILP